MLSFNTKVFYKRHSRDEWDKWDKEKRIVEFILSHLSPLSLQGCFWGRLPGVISLGVLTYARYYSLRNLAAEALNSIQIF